MLAARAIGRPEEPYLGSLAIARNPDGSLYHIIGTRPGHWRFDLHAEAIDGTVWATWADREVNFNPFQVASFGSPLPPAGPAGGSKRRSARLRSSGDGGIPKRPHRTRRRRTALRPRPRRATPDRTAHRLGHSARSRSPQRRS